jgi:hypothetical protein
MPTLADIAGLSASTANTSVLDGVSLVPLLMGSSISNSHGGSVDSGSGRGGASWVPKPAFSQYPRRYGRNASEPWKDDGIDHVNRCERMLESAGGCAMYGVLWCTCAATACLFLCCAATS